MEVLCFYYHEHELANLNNDKYGFVNFYDLPEEPEIDYTFFKNGKEVRIFNCIAFAELVSQKINQRVL